MLDHQHFGKQEEFFQKMCREEVTFSELKKFIADRELAKIHYRMNQILGEIGRDCNASNTHFIKESFTKFGKIKMLRDIIKNIPDYNLDSYVGVIDTCNIALNGAENCDIIIGRATEDELQIYVYELMKTWEEKKNKRKEK